MTEPSGDTGDWKDGGGFSKPGIGERETPWPNHSASGPFGTANPSCATCGGRLRGAKVCTCDDPVWMVRGERVTLPADSAAIGETPDGIAVTETALLILGDCLDVLRTLEPRSVDAIVTDPPYGINFMGQAWDGKAIEEAASKPRDLGGIERLTGDPDHPERRKMTVRTGSAFANRAGEAGAYDFSVTGNRAFQAWVEQWATECLRVLKPGGHALVFGGTRTYHRLASGLEDAGFEIRDCLAWMFGSGFPKSHDVSKAIDKTLGAEREVVGTREPTGYTRANVEQGAQERETWEWNELSGEPVTDEARAYQGWGTALKPAFEPIVVARKPLSGTVAATVLAHGTGALNIEACRVAFQDEGDESEAKGKNRHADFDSGPRENAVYGTDDRTRAEQGNYDPPGRWPANVILDEDAAALLDAQTGERGGHDHRVLDALPNGALYDDRGGASRFFYCAKVSRAERSAGLDGFEERQQDPGREPGLPGGDNPRNRGAQERRNHHPTVKPIALMRWLIRLVTPPGGLVLDPFTGSGSTGCAATLEGTRFLGIEREPDYAAVAEARIRFWAEHGEEALRIVATREQAERVREAVAETGQLDLLGMA